MEKNDNNNVFGMLPQLLMGFIGRKNKKFSFDLDNFKIELPNFSEPIKLSGKVTIDFSNKKEGKK